MELRPEKIFVVILISVIVVIGLSVLLMLFFNYARKKIIQKEQEKSKLIIEHQKNILKATIETQEQERKRIAQDLHDDISAKLNVVSLNTNVLLDGGLAPYGVQQTLKHILKVTHTVLQSSREIAHNLLPPVLDKFGLKEGLEELAEEFTTSGFRVSYELEYTKPLAKEAELHVFRIAQELLNNSLKHGQASEATLHLNITNNKQNFEYTDNGIGFNVEKALQKKGLGLSNLYSRVDILKGSMTIEKKAPKGMRFNIIF